MSSYDKLLDEIKRNPHKVKFNDLDKVLTHEGFERRQSNKGSSHYIYTRKGDYPISIPKDNPVNEVYVKQVIKLLGL